MKVLAFAAIVVLAGFFAWQTQFSEPPATAARGRPPAPVSVIAVSERRFEDTIPALGTLQAWESTDITAPVSQLVTALNFEDGQRVVKGQVLATLRQNAELALRSELMARIADARREVKRLTDLAKRNQVAQTDLDTAATNVQVLEHQLSEAEARLADRTITAPFAGVLGLREVSEGALVSAGQRLTTLDDITRMRLQFTVPERYLGALSQGMLIEATTAAFPGDFVGVLTAIDSRIDPVARSVTARAMLENESGKLRPGLLMEVRITGEVRNAIMVPEESLQSRAARHFVWRIDGENALRSEVTIGARVPGWVEVLSGLMVGDTIVKDGVVRLSGNSMPVAVVQS